MKKLVLICTAFVLALPAVAIASPPSPKVVCECGGSGQQWCRDPFSGQYYRC